MPDCQSCKSWGGCPGQVWYSYGDIRYCKNQVQWLLRYIIPNYPDGKWLPPPQEIATEVKRAFHSDAFFVNTEVIIGELNWRLEQCEQDGEILKTLNQETFDTLRMVKLLRMPFEEVEERAYWALKFCVGWRRKRTSYRIWKNIQRGRQLTKYAKI